MPAYVSPLAPAASALPRTIGSWSSLLTSPRVTASTAARWAGSSPARRVDALASSCWRTPSARARSARMVGASFAERWPLMNPAVSSPISTRTRSTSCRGPSSPVSSTARSASRSASTTPGSCRTAAGRGERDRWRDRGGRGDHQVGGGQLLVDRRQRHRAAAQLGGEGGAVRFGAVGDHQLRGTGLAHAAAGQLGHLARPDDQDAAAGQRAELALGDLETDRKGGGQPLADRRLVAGAAADPQRLGEQRVQHRAHGALGLGRLERLALLADREPFQEVERGTAVVEADDEDGHASAPSLRALRRALALTGTAAVGGGSGLADKVHRGSA